MWRWGEWSFVMVRIESGTAVLKMQAENLSEMFYSVNTVFKHRIFLQCEEKPCGNTVLFSHGFLRSQAI